MFYSYENSIGLNANKQFPCQSHRSERVLHNGGRQWPHYKGFRAISRQTLPVRDHAIRRSCSYASAVRLDMSGSVCLMENWWWTQSPANPSLVDIPVMLNNRVFFRFFAISSAVSAPKTPVSWGFQAEFPAHKNRDFSENNRELCAQEQ